MANNVFEWDEIRVNQQLTMVSFPIFLLEIDWAGIFLVNLDHR